MKKQMLAVGLVSTFALGIGCGNGSLGGDDDDDATHDAAPDAWFDECVGVNESARNMRGPADVVFAIDNTPSMYNEIEELRANMNRFSDMVEAEGLNLNIVLVACRTEECIGDHDNWYTVCIDPPVGSGACPDDDSNPPQYLHVDNRIESLKALENIVGTYSDWSSMLRDESAKHVVVISDDNDEWGATQFNDAFTALDSRLVGYYFHSIFSYLGKEDACAAGGDPCCDYAAPSGEGTVYRDLVTLTDGVSGNLCLQDFDPVFDALAGAVVESATLSCEWAIPEPPEDEELAPNLVNVEFVDGDGDPHLIHRVDSEAQCDMVEQGWYYDDPDEPTHIHVCPQTCTWIQGQEGSQMRIVFGCESEFDPVL